MSTPTDLTKRIEELVAQQLPSLKHLEQLFISVTAAKHTSEGKQPKLADVSTHKLDEYHTELRGKLDELMSTPYATELMLIILPVLIRVKKDHS